MNKEDQNCFPVFTEFFVGDSNGLCLANTYIPEEILFHILTFIEPKQLLKYSLVCRRWNNLIKSYALWAKIYKLRYNKKPKPLPWYLYYCLLSTDLFDVNLLRNGNGQQKFENWDIISNGGDQWIVEDAPIGADMLPLNISEFYNKTSCFATSYGLCSKEQTIKFGQSKLFRHILDCYKPHIYLSEWTAGRFDCGSMYRLRCAFTGIDMSNKNLYKPGAVHSVVQGEGRQWVKIEIVVMEYPENIDGIIFEHGGCDVQFWAGHYGSKMAGGVVKLLFDSIEPLNKDRYGYLIPKKFTEIKVVRTGQNTNETSLHFQGLYEYPILVE